MAGINFFSEEIDFKLPKPRKTAKWVKTAILQEKKKLKELNYIFCSDEYLRRINLEYLSHKSYTDIITFDNSESPGLIEGDIYISINRINDNSIKFKTAFIDELHRVIIHGVLHLIGYSDKSPPKKLIMRKKEDVYLSLLNRS